MLQIDGNTYSDILADKIIVEANKLGIVESLFLLIDNTSSLTKQLSNWSVIKEELKAFHVFDGDLVWGCKSWELGWKVPYTSQGIKLLTHHPHKRTVCKWYCPQCSCQRPQWWHHCPCQHSLGWRWVLPCWRNVSFLPLTLSCTAPIQHCAVYSCVVIVFFAKGSTLVCGVVGALALCTFLLSSFKVGAETAEHRYNLRLGVLAGDLQSKL